MSTQDVSQFKASAMDNDTIRRWAPSIFAEGPRDSVSKRYTFVPTARIVDGLRGHGWVPVAVEEQPIRIESRRGFQRHLLRLRLADQMATLDEWNVELVLVNSHDGGCAYQLHAGLFRRICSNGLVLSDTRFEAIRFRHSGLQPEEVVQASFRLIEVIPQISGLVEGFRKRLLEDSESHAFALHALRLRYTEATQPPVDPGTLLKARRPEDTARDLWTTLNRVQENLIRGGVSDHHRDRRGKLRSVRAIRGIDSKVTLNKGIWGLAERLAQGHSIAQPETITLPA
jgi:hypothetical protein